jgi:putative transposase
VKDTQHPGQRIWSSDQATVGEIASPAFLSTGWLLEKLDRQPQQARLTYERFIGQGIGLRLWDNLKSGVLLGNQGFAELMRPLLRDLVQSKGIPRAERMLAKPRLEEMFQDTERDKAVRNDRIPAAVRERDYTLFQVHEYLGMHYSTISRIVERVDEERRAKNKTWP